MSRFATRSFCFGLTITLLLIFWFYQNRASNLKIWGAVRSQDLQAIESYVDGGGNLETGAFMRRTTPLREALVNEKFESYRKLLELGANPNKICRGQPSIIQWAAGMDDAKWLRLALENGGDANLISGSKLNGKSPPIFWALTFGTDESVDLLKNADIDLECPDFVGLSPLAHAIDRRRFCFAKWYVETKRPSVEEIKEDTVLLNLMTASSPFLLGPSANQEFESYKFLRRYFVENQLIANEDFVSLDRVLVDPSKENFFRRAVNDPLNR